MRYAGHDYLIKIFQEKIKRFTPRRGDLRQALFHRPRDRTRFYRKLFNILEIPGDPFNNLMAVFPELISIHQFQLSETESARRMILFFFTSITPPVISYFIT